MRALGLEGVIREAIRERQRASGYAEEEKVEALVLLLAAGGDEPGLGLFLGHGLPDAGGGRTGPGEAEDAGRERGRLLHRGGAPPSPG